MRKVLLLFLIFAATARAQLTQQGQEVRVTGCTGSSCNLVASNSPVNPNLLVNSGTNTFLLGVSPSTNSARLYITNDTANSCANLTVTMASTGNSTITSFNNNVNAWQALQVAAGSGGFASSAPLTLPASGTVAITTQPIIGTQLAVFVVLSSGCATTSVDMQIVFGTFSPPVSAVQGVVAVGGNPASENPVVIGYKDSGSGLVGMVAGSNGGINLGGSGVSVGGTYSQVLAPAFAPGQNAPIIEAIYANTPGGSQVGPLMESLPAGAGACTNTSGCPGIFTADAGFWSQPATLSNTGSTAFTLWRGPVASGFGNIATSIVESCSIHISATNTAGTTPTLDVFFQDGINGIIWNDRIHFNQITAGGNQAAGIGGASANEPVTTYTDGTIAAGTIVGGPLGPWARLKFVVGGTGSPTYNITFGVVCK